MGRQPHVPALRKRGRPTADERRTRETEILTAALDVFLRTGYGATTVDELASAAQVTKRTLYAYYGDKAEVFAAMVRQLAAAVSLDAASDRDTLETLAARIVSRLHSDELVGLHQLVIAESTRFPELALILHGSGDARHVARLAEHIRAERGPAWSRSRSRCFPCCSASGIVGGCSASTRRPPPCRPPRTPTRRWHCSAWAGAAADGPARRGG